MITHFPRSNYHEFARREGCRRNDPLNRPEWLRRIPKPYGIVGYSVDQVGSFMWSWSLYEMRRAKRSAYCFQDSCSDVFEKLTPGSVIFMLPFGFMPGGENSHMATIRQHADRNGYVTIQVPMNIARGEPWTIEDSMCIATRIAIAQHAQKGRALLLDESDED